VSCSCDNLLLYATTAAQCTGKAAKKALKKAAAARKKASEARLVTYAQQYFAQLATNMKGTTATTFPVYTLSLAQPVSQDPVTKHCMRLIQKSDTAILVVFSAAVCHAASSRCI
jgi:hypothetical protein